MQIEGLADFDFAGPVFEFCQALEETLYVHIIYSGATEKQKGFVLLTNTTEIPWTI